MHHYLKNHAVIPGPKAKAGLLNMEGRLLHYVIARILNVRGGNYATILEFDIILMWVLHHRLCVNWPWFITEHLLHCKRKKNDPTPYTIMITRFFNHFHFAEPTITTRLNNNNKIGKGIMAQIGI